MSAAKKMMVGSTWNAKMKPKVFASSSLPKMNSDPTLLNSSRWTKLLAERVEQIGAERHFQYERGEQDLQRDAGGDEFPVDRAAVVGEREGDKDQYEQAEKAEQDVPKGSQHRFPPKPRVGAGITARHKLAERSSCPNGEARRREALRRVGSVLGAH